MSNISVDFIAIITGLFAVIILTASTIWAEISRRKDAMVVTKHVEEVKEVLAINLDSTDVKLNEIHDLVNDQLSQAVKRFEAALVQIDELKDLLKKKAGMDNESIKNQLGRR